LNAIVDDFSQLLRFRRLVRVLVTRNTKLKYQRSFLGFLWTLLNPLLMIGILLTVFTHVIRIPIDAYWAFLLSGYFAFHSVTQSLNASAFVYLEYAAMVRNVVFPVVAPVFAAAISRFLEFLLELAMIVVLLAVVHHHTVPASFVVLPLLLALQFLLVIGLSLPIAALSVYYYDIRHVLSILLTALFYVSPVFYRADMVPEKFRTLYFLNPISGLLNAYQTTLYDGVFPSASQLGVLTLQVMAICLVGYAFFCRHKNEFAEVV
jgi:ABC-type polysaccharide/polyol phosphate export permease